MYRLIFTSQNPKPPHRHYRTGSLVKAKYNDEIIQIFNNESYQKLLDNPESIVSLEMNMKYFRKSTEPNPNILTINILFKAFDSAALQLLDDLKIEYISKPITILNDNAVHYTFVAFPTVEMLNLEASHIFTKDGRMQTERKGYLDVDSFILKPEAKKLKGIFRLNSQGNILICDQETKEKLEETKLTAFYFEPVKIGS